VRHGVGHLLLNDVFRVLGVQHHTRGPDAAHERAPLYAFTMQCLYATRCFAVGFRHRSRHAVRVHQLASRKAPRNLARPADHASCRPTWRVPMLGFARHAPI